MIEFKVFHIPSGAYIEDVSGLRVITKEGKEKDMIQVYHANGFSKFDLKDLRISINQNKV